MAAGMGDYDHKAVEHLASNQGAAGLSPVGTAKIRAMYTPPATQIGRTGSRTCGPTAPDTARDLGIAAKQRGRKAGTPKCHNALTRNCGID